MRKSLLFSAVAIACFSMCVTVTFAQSRELRRQCSEEEDAIRNDIPFPISLFVPSGIVIGYKMRSYIRSAAFGDFDSSASRNPQIVFNEIYDEAVQQAHGDLTTAFLAASFGSFEHEYIPLNFFGSELDIPLTSENHSQFLRRVSHLPEHLYDSAEGDRDKIQHFFASAWLKSALGMDWLVHLAGHAVELGEKLFTVGGFEDPRDLHANDDGLHFAMRAGANQECHPSASLTPNP